MNTFYFRKTSIPYSEIKGLNKEQFIKKFSSALRGYTEDAWNKVPAELKATETKTMSNGSNETAVKKSPEAKGAGADQGGSEKSWGKGKDN